jgi:hypothetical protein
VTILNPNLLSSSEILKETPIFLNELDVGKPLVESVLIESAGNN